MKKTILTAFISLFAFASTLHAQSKAYEETISKKSGSLEVHYFSVEPSAYKGDGEIQGIEIDILKEFQQWLQEKKSVTLELDYKEYPKFEEMYKSVQETEGNQIGLGTITINEARELEVDFSAPYMKNVSILVTAGEIKTARTEKELKELLSTMQAVTVKGSSHDEYLKKMYKDRGIPLKISYIDFPDQVFDKIKESPRNFGYVDVITFWKFLKEEKDQYVKMHSIANNKDEYFGFIFPKNSGWANEFNEFLESGFGFTATKEYRKILEKYLSYEILNSVELNP